ncbi:Fic family protein [Aquisphaera insulae]|uniref:Fic family protein n=1 Tax=Aquisphaera insulae TaxID=2712864 RepID=UPI0013EA2B40|nr:Fic family protein [Aquisphaera insulae]
MPFQPNYRITDRAATYLMRIGAARQAVEDLPITAAVLAGLRETARRFSTHYSTRIEGNRLTQEEVSAVIERQGSIPGRERDEAEVLGYYAALEQMERFAAQNEGVTDLQVRTLHALVMAGGKAAKKPSPYRGGQNVIRESGSRRIVYMPPEARDVPRLMNELLDWLRRSEREDVPCPIRAGIAHYQFATIHPYYDGNGRTARLLTTLIMHRGGYDLKGLYSLEEYYARDLAAYYQALTVGPSHNYYLGRAEADITGWVEYFCAGVANSFEGVRRRAREAADRDTKDASAALRRLDPRQRRALDLFRRSVVITSRDVEGLFGISQRMARNVLSSWVQSGFVIVVDPARKSRRYRLSPEYEKIARSNPPSYSVQTD